MPKSINICNGQGSIFESHLPSLIILQFLANELGLNGTSNLPIYICMYVCTVSYITQCNNANFFMGPCTSLNSKATNADILYFHPQPPPHPTTGDPNPPNPPNPKNPFFLRILSRSTVIHPGISP